MYFKSTLHLHCMDTTPTLYGHNNIYVYKPNAMSNPFATYQPNPTFLTKYGF